MTSYELLGLAGGALSATGVFLALVGTSKVRAGVVRFVEWVHPGPVEIRTGSATIVLEAATVKARGRVGPGPDGWTNEEWHEHLEGRIDQLAVEFDHHDHPEIEKLADRLSASDAETRRMFEEKLTELASDAATSERWNVWGLGLAGTGALVQLTAVVVVTLA